MLRTSPTSRSTSRSAKIDSGVSGLEEKVKKTALLVAVMFLLNGCAPWIRTGGLHEAKGENVSLDLPDGWMRLNKDEYLLVTRDGVSLQSILVESINVTEPLKHTKKK